MKCVWLTAALLALPVLGDTVTVPCDRDNTIYESGDNTSNGAGAYLFAGANLSAQVRRALVHFGVAGSVPAGAVITSVRLRVTVSAVPPESPAAGVELRRLLEDWGEGASDAGEPGGRGTTAEPGDATWTFRFYDTQTWSTVGGTFAGAASGSTTLGDVGAYEFASSAGMVADAQAWLDNPSSNFGWLLLGEEGTPASARRLDSRENIAGDGPTLTIEYTLGSNCSPCPADFNNSGGTPDDADVAAFFAAWNDGDACADTNASGGTPDDADIARFFQLWNDGGC